MSNILATSSSAEHEPSNNMSTLRQRKTPQGKQPELRLTTPQGEQHELLLTTPQGEQNKLPRTASPPPRKQQQSEPDEFENLKLFCLVVLLTYDLSTPFALFLVFGWKTALVIGSALAVETGVVIGAYCMWFGRWA